MTKSKKPRKRSKTQGFEPTRIERDSLGERRVPSSAYYGIQTLRASENFPISAILPKPVFIVSYAMVKRSAAEANMELGLLSKKVGKAVSMAANEIIAGKLHDQFIVDVYQAGAGTSHNMNTNEVIANRAGQLLGDRLGSYRQVHPNDHVNMAQSTNDSFPTAMRVAALLSLSELRAEFKGLETELKKKARAFDKVIKSARTHLQDAVPIRLGQEFSSYASAVERARGRIEEASTGIKLIGLGATAAGTGLNSHPKYRSSALKHLKATSGIKGLKPAPDLVEALNSMSDFVAFSAALRGAAVELSRIANDLRLLSSGPGTGLAEIKLPPVQPGSSIMPGKVNPVMAEMLNMVCFQVMGNDTAVASAAGAGQFELNVMGPVINYNILQSMEILSKALSLFTERCVKGIKADKARCRAFFENSEGLATLLNPYIGYDMAAKVVARSNRTGKSVIEVIRDMKILTAKEIEALFNPLKVTAPANPPNAKARR